MNADVTVENVDETTPAPSRFNVRKAAKITAITATAAAVLLYAKSKLNSSVEGSVTATVETDPS